jgi:hypothetical protein
MYHALKKKKSHLYMKEGCLFVLGLFGRLLRRRGALACFHGVWTCGVEVLEY